MNIYFVIYLILLLFSFLEISNISKKYLKIFQGIVVFIFIFIAGLRYETGVDWLGYENYFDEIIPLHEAIISNSILSVFVSLDLGYSLLNSVIKMFGGDIQVVFIIVSILSTILLVKNLKYYSNNVLTSLMIYYPLFFFIFDMSGIRQGLAIQIVLFSLKYIPEKKFNHFLFFIILATSIHWTAILLLPLYLFANKRISKIYTILFLIISVIIFTFKIKWLHALMGGLVNQINSFTMLSDKVQTYTTDEVFSQQRGWDLFSFYNFVRITIIIIIMNIYKKNFINSVSNFNIFYNLIIIELICIFCLFEFYEISERLRFYFTIAEVVILSSFIFFFKNHIVRIFILMIIGFGIFLNAYPYILQFPSTIAYHPYQNYLLHNIFDLSSDGYSRLQEHKASHE